MDRLISSSRRLHRRPWVGAWLAGVLLVTACTGGGAVGSAVTTADSSPAASLGDPTTDKLAQILDRGTILLSTDPEYPPQSFAVEGAERPVDTRCAANQLTAAEISGFDAETGRAVAERLGVEPCFLVPRWTEITGGNWGDRWDVSWGSGSINADRMTRLWMTQPYYGVPNYFFVRDDSTYQVATDLSGTAIGACASCSHEAYLRGELDIPGVEIVLEVEDHEIVTFQAESTGLEAVADGDLQAFVAAGPVGDAAIEDGLPLRRLEKPAFTYFPSGFVDKGSALDQGPFIARINEIIRSLHADGTLRAASIEFFGVDYASAGASFDLESIGQIVP